MPRRQHYASLRFPLRLFALAHSRWCTMLLASLALCIPPCSADAAPQIRSRKLVKQAPGLNLRYSLRLQRPTTHLMEVQIEAANAAEPSLDFIMPAWAPGRYAIYNFAKNVQEFQALGAQGQPLPWTQPDKQTWRAQTAGSDGTVRVRYRVFANDLTGSFSQFDSTHANVNGAGVYMYVAGHKPDPIRLEIEAPAGWQILSGFSLDTDQHRLEAPSYDGLIDTPVEISPECRIEQFVEHGKRFRVVVHAYGGDAAADNSISSSGSSSRPAIVEARWRVKTPSLEFRSAQSRHPSQEMTQLLEGLKKVVQSEMAMMPEPDFDHYTFLFHFAPDISMGDGMEHLNSTQIIVRGAFTGAIIDEAVETAAHEFFHLWNVKRLRPAGLGPFDYTKEDYTKSLWFAEGVTQYYSYVHLLRAGLWTRAQFLERLADEIRKLEVGPGRALMSAESSSFHAWFYDRAPQIQETNFANATVSYYNKGALLGMLLDLEIRARTQGVKSLDDVLRLMYRNFYEAGQIAVPDAASKYYLPGRGYAETDIVQALSSIAAGDMTQYFNQYISGVERLPYAEALHRAGLELRVLTAAGSPPSLGAFTRQQDRGVKILDVLPGGAADRAGVSRDDTLIDMDQLPLASEDLNTRLKMYPPGTEVPFGVERHGRKLRISVKLDPPVPDQYSIEELRDATSDQLHIREGWLGKQTPQ
jgi:predicted metalloprotease with PDZ domain